ncbi:hypothetical protein JCM6882_007952 [Rhodosporidiobolus microsporus]
MSATEALLAPPTAACTAANCAQRSAAVLRAPSPPLFDFEAHGDSLLAENQPNLAVGAYSQGLSAATADEEKLVLHLNRAQAHLLLDKFGSALRDAEAVLSLLSTGVAAPSDAELKATLRRARALEGMRLLPAALQGYGAALKLDPKNKDVKAGKARVEEMLRETKTGEFDWFRVEKEASVASKKKAFERINSVGDYVGPVQVVELPNRGGGRGIVATRDVAVGELLLVEKAFAVGEAPPDMPAEPYSSYGFPTLSTEEHRDLVANIAQRMLDDPTTVPVIHSLHGGSDFLPSFPTSLTSLANRSLYASEKALIDSARIREIVLSNAFSLSLATHEQDSVNPSGLFPNASLFNHACSSNAYWSNIADIIVIRAIAPIRAGEEVFISYVAANEPREERLAYLQHHFGDARCDCQLCRIDEADGPANLQRRNDLLVETRIVRHGFDSRAIKKDKLVALVAQLENTYPSTHDVHLRPEMIRPYRSLAKLCGRDSSSASCEANEYDLKALRSTGAVLNVDEQDVNVVRAPFVRPRLAVPLLLSVAGRLVANGSKEDVAQGKLYVRAAMSMERVLRGSSVEHFLFTYGEEVDKRGLRWMCELEAGSV